MPSSPDPSRLLLRLLKASASQLFSAFPFQPSSLYRGRQRKHNVQFSINHFHLNEIWILWLIYLVANELYFHFSPRKKFKWETKKSNGLPFSFPSRLTNNAFGFLSDCKFWMEHWWLTGKCYLIKIVFVNQFMIY